MSLQINFSERASNDIEYHKKSGNKILVNKIFVLLSELYHTPYEGTGKPEPLKHHLSGMWSRRINKEHRIIYVLDRDGQSSMLSD